MFQSLFWWKYCPGNNYLCGVVEYVTEFQSLFWWKYCPGSILRFPIQQGAKVSILVLVEVLPWAVRSGSTKVTTSARFNPCSGGSIALGLPRAPEEAEVRVSILVLVEVLPWVRQARRQAAPMKRVSILVLVEVLPWAICPLVYLSLLAQVSILVLVEVLPWASESRKVLVGQVMFQSLFWWKYCPGFSSYGFVSGLRSEFQSLFWWKYCPGFQARLSMVFCHSAKCRFNPCSGGSIALGYLPPCVFVPARPSFNPCSGGSIALGF